MGSAPEDSATLRLSVDGSCALIQIDNPARRNAMNYAMWARLPQLLAELNNQVRVLLLRGAGGTFCAGADISEFLRLAEDPERIADHQHCVEQAQLALERFAAPTLAVVQGSCFGGGMGLALSCDFRIATSDSRFAITPARLGIAYSLADTRRLHRTVGAPLCRQMLLLARELDAERALAAGLVDEVVATEQLEARVQLWTDEIRAHSPFTQKSLKRTLNVIEGSGADTEQSLRELLLEGFSGEDMAEGVAAFMQKRKPRFGG